MAADDETDELPPRFILRLFFSLSPKLNKGSIFVVGFEKLCACTLRVTVTNGLHKSGNHPSICDQMVAVPVQSSSRRPRQIHRPSWTEIEDGEINEEAEQIILDALRDSRKNSPMTVASPSSPSGTDTHPPSRGPRSTSGVITSE
jgi:hypothetical protein